MVLVTAMISILVISPTISNDCRLRSVNRVDCWLKDLVAQPLDGAVGPDSSGISLLATSVTVAINFL